MKRHQLKSLIKSIIKESMTTRAELDAGTMKAVNLEEIKNLSVPEKHQLRIALQTLKMTDAGASIMGGMNKEEAREFLKRIGYTDQQIQKFEQGLNESVTSFQNEKIIISFKGYKLLEVDDARRKGKRMFVAVTKDGFRTDYPIKYDNGQIGWENPEWFPSEFKNQVSKYLNDLGEVSEESGTGAVAGYATPNAFKKKVTENIQDPTHDEMLEFLRRSYGKEEGFEFDAEGAIYWFANFYHGGQSSNLYSALSTSQFRPGDIARGPEKDSSEEMMYRDLVHQFAGGEGLDDGEEEVNEEKHPMDDYDQQEISKVTGAFQKEIDGLKQSNEKFSKISFGYIGNVWNDVRYQPQDDRSWYVWNSGKKWGGFPTKELPKMWEQWEKNKEKILHQITYLGEMTGTGAVAGYQTPFAFSKNKNGSKRATDATKKLGYKVVGPAPRV